MFDFLFLGRIIMCEINDKKTELGWLKLFIIGNRSNPTSRTVYIYKDKMVYAVLHTDTTGATKAISLPAKEQSGSEYVCMLDNGERSLVNVYPHVVNIHYIDKNVDKSAEEL